MPPFENWKERFSAELDLARQARHRGNEGMARVCARRAAGIVVGEYLSRRGYPIPGASAHQRLKLLSNLPGIPVEIIETSRHFLIHVTPEHDLPIEVDLIEDVIWLANQLLNKTNHPSISAETNGG